MKSVRFHPKAEAEMMEAAAWYETRQAGLGKRFLTSVQDAISRTTLNPQMYPLIDPDVRRCLTRTFPFGVVFRIAGDCIVVIAVMHLHREPHCWKARTDVDAGLNEG